MCVTYACAHVRRHVGGMCAWISVVCGSACPGVREQLASRASVYLLRGQRASQEWCLPGEARKRGSCRKLARWGLEDASGSIPGWGRARGLLGCASPLPCETAGDRRAPDTPAQPSFPSGPLLFSSLTSPWFSLPPWWKASLQIPTPCFSKIKNIC